MDEPATLQSHKRFARDGVKAMLNALLPRFASTLSILPFVFCICALLEVLTCNFAAAQGGWQLIWSDEFNSNSINTNNWHFDIGNGTGGWGNNELEYYTSRPVNVYVT